MAVQKLHILIPFLFPSYSFCIRNGCGFSVRQYIFAEKRCGSSASESCRQFGTVCSLIHDDDRDPRASMQNKCCKEKPNKWQCFIFIWNTILSINQFSDVFIETMVAMRIPPAGQACDWSCVSMVQRSHYHSVTLPQCHPTLVSP